VAAGSPSATWPEGSSPPASRVPTAPTLIARFTVNGWDERTIDGLDGGWMGAVEMRKEFTAGLAGSLMALYVSSGDTEGQRSYVAAERITAATDESNGFREGNGGFGGNEPVVGPGPAPVVQR
jgi:uncharacterized protein DUF3224